MKMTRRRHRIAFVTGTRAEYGLMVRVLRAIERHPRLELHVVVTGMHLDRSLGHTLDDVAADRWQRLHTVAWKQQDTPVSTAAATGRAITALSKLFATLQIDTALVVGDRVEAFAAATAAHLCRIRVAHVHGGDRALGQVDDALRHAITKLAHLHFAATDDSARRIIRLGENPAHVHVVGSPGVEDITREALPWCEVSAELAKLSRPISGAGRAGRRHDAPPARRGYALLALHPVDPDARIERMRTLTILRALAAHGPGRVVAIGPNNDPGSGGIVAALAEAMEMGGDVMPVLTVVPSAPREMFLGLLNHAALLIGNSSSGIIEAGSFGTPVINVGPRQQGRLHGSNVTHSGYDLRGLARAVAGVWRGGRAARCVRDNPYARPGTSRRIASLLAAEDGKSVPSKLIAY